MSANLRPAVPPRSPFFKHHREKTTQIAIKMENEVQKMLEQMKDALNPDEKAKLERDPDDLDAFLKEFNLTVKEVAPILQTERDEGYLAYLKKSQIMK